MVCHRPFGVGLQEGCHHWCVCWLPESCKWWQEDILLQQCYCKKVPLASGLSEITESLENTQWLHGFLPFMATSMAQNSWRKTYCIASEFCRNTCLAAGPQQRGFLCWNMQNAPRLVVVGNNSMDTEDLNEENQHAAQQGVWHSDGQQALPPDVCSTVSLTSLCKVGRHRC